VSFDLAAARKAGRAELAAHLAAGAEWADAARAVLADLDPPPDDIGAVYEALLPAPARRTGGTHCTPPELAAEVVARTLDPLLDASGGELPYVCDPALGGGVFLLAAARHLQARTGRPLTEIAARLYGVDQDPLAVELARWALHKLLGDEPALHLHHGDSLIGFDWRAAFPEVFARGGFDAVIGNPPFLGGSFISGAWGNEYRERLVVQVAGGRRGNADLCAYFFLRAHDLLRSGSAGRPGGRAGLVATNTISEGATRRIGLDLLAERGGEVTEVARQFPWPGEAKLHVTLVWFRRGATRPAPHRPPRLAANAGLAFNGAKIYGQGFVLNGVEAEALRQADARHDEVLRRYLGGDDLYGRSDAAPSRWVIDFRDWPLERAARYPMLLERVERLVKPERERLHGRNAIGDKRAERWWQFGSPTPALDRALVGRKRALAKVLHSHTHAFWWVDPSWIFSHALCVFADEDSALLAILQSSLHEAWALRHGSSLGHAPRYTLSATFETFPMPPRSRELADVADALDAHRRAVMAARGEGLTRLHLRLNDPAERDAAIAAWRDLQVALDDAVARAYGWTPAWRHGFHDGPRGPRFGPAAEVLEEGIELLRARQPAAVQLVLPNL
jgi:hypothetical protein